MLSKLPEGRRLSILLDCWTSSFTQAFWQLQATLSIETGTTVEVLLGFEHLHGAHTGSYLSETVIEILRGHGIADRVLSVTTDNAKDNNTMIATQYSHWF